MKVIHNQFEKLLPVRSYISGRIIADIPHAHDSANGVFLPSLLQWPWVAVPEEAISQSRFFRDDPEDSRVAKAQRST
jgi:hypothetical protein